PRVGQPRAADGDRPVSMTRRKPAQADVRPATKTPAPAPTNGRPRIGDVLIDLRAVSPEDVEQALARQNGSGIRVGTLLVEAGVVTERIVTEALSKQLEIPLVDLRQHAPDAEALARLPDTFAREHVALPLRLKDDVIAIV